MESVWHKIKLNFSVVVICMCMPLLLWAVNGILPTHDDWATLTRPTFEPLFIKERWLFYGYHWRPFDSFFGYILGLNPSLIYPTLNHCCVVIGHVLNSCLVYYILKSMKFHHVAINIATLYFFISPATMATVSAVDSMNQIYSLFWGMVAFIVYIKTTKAKYVIWIITLVIATLCKENGLMWALIGPLLAYGFGGTSWRILRRDLIVAMIFMVVYALLILFLPSNIIIANSYVPEVIKSVHNFIKFLFTSFITIDYIYLLHKPSRNLPLAFLSMIPTIPFFYFVFIHHGKLFMEKRMLCVIICLLIAVAPHVFTVFSMMHTYAGLSLMAVMIAYSLNKYDVCHKIVACSFVLYALAAIIINIHLIDSSIKSSIIGKQMAQEAIRKTGEPVKSAYVIIIEDDYPKLSSFCVIPSEAFGWGHATRYETNYQWPEIISDTTITRTPDAMIQARNLAHEALYKQQYDCSWIVNHQDIEVIKK